MDDELTPGEVNYGMVRDHFSWDAPLNSDASQAIGPFQVFSAVGPSADDGDPLWPVARAEHLSIYVRTFGDGQGENGLHSHDDDSFWLVLKGSAAFAGEGGQDLGSLGEHQGVLIPKLTSYKFVCSGETVLARVAGRGEISTSEK